jgi:putative membrane protein insertion efficiency factor
MGDRDGGGAIGAALAAAWQTACRGCDAAASAALVGLIVLYKTTLSPLLGRHCRFQPSCSTYFREAVEKYGALRGSLRGIARISRCHPFHPGGHDPP